MNKPNGMCTISYSLKEKTVTIGFHKSEQAQAHRNHLVQAAMESSLGKVKQMENGINFTEEELQSATAQTMIETLSAIRSQADDLEKFGASTVAEILRNHANEIEKDINESLGRPSK